MLQNSITFDELPGAVSSLTALVRELVKEVGELRKMLAPERAIPKSATQFIGIAEACQILGKAQSNVYALAREGKIPAYKVPGEKEWRFIPGEHVDHVKGYKRESSVMSFDEMEADIRRGTRAKSPKLR